VLDAKHSPQANMGSDVAGVHNANSGSATDSLTREHRMTLDEAQLILNVKRDDNLEIIMKVRHTAYRMEWIVSNWTTPQNYEHLFKANSPPVPKAEGSKKHPTRKEQLVTQSHYLQSKVQRALFRMEAERKVAANTTAQSEATSPPTQANTQLPPSESQP